jgi:dihydroorotase
MNIKISNGRVIDPAHDIDAVQDLYISGGRVVALGSAPDGFIDLAARLREPGFEYRATLESEMDAAMAGGVTSLAIPPDTDPALDEPGLVEMLCYRAKQLNRAHVYPVGSLTIGLRGERLSEMAQLVEAGCFAFSQANVPIVDNAVLMRAMQYASTFGFRIWLQPLAPFLSCAHPPRAWASPAFRSRPRRWHCLPICGSPASPAHDCTSRACRAPKVWR